MAVERYGSKTDVIVKLVLVFFISLLSFSIGTFVGKKFSDNQHKLSQLEPGHESNESASTEESAHNTSSEARDVASIPEDVHSVKPGEPLSDIEIAKLAEEFVTDEETNQSPDADGHGDKKSVDKHAPTQAKSDGHNAEPAATPKVAEGHATDSHREPSSAANKIAASKATTNEKPSAVVEHKETKSLTADAATTAVGKFTVQIAAYPKEEEAKNMANELKSKGFSAFYVEVEVSGKTWYRVNLGLFATSKEASAYKDDLLARKKVSSAFVQQIVK